MRKPSVSKPRTAWATFSLSRTLPKLRLPASSATAVQARPRPQIGKPGKSSPPPRPAGGKGVSVTASEELAPCARCAHPESLHPVRYVCDKYPHPDPLQLCGCESDHLGDPCADCGHKARSHKPRHRCMQRHECGCWGYEEKAAP